MPYNSKSLLNLRQIKEKTLLIKGKEYLFPEEFPWEIIEDPMFFCLGAKEQKETLEEFYSKEENSGELEKLQVKEKKAKSYRPVIYDNDLEKEEKEEKEEKKEKEKRPETFEDFLAFLKRKYKQIQELEVSPEKEQIKAKLLERLGKQIFYTQASLDEKDGLINTFLVEKDRLEKKLKGENKSKDAKVKLEDLM